MQENNRSQDQQGRPTEETRQDTPNQPRRGESTPSIEENPQQGQQWSNYQTRELSSNPKDNSEAHDEK